MTRKRTQLLPSLPLLIVLLTVLAPAALAYDPDFSFYPEDSLSCLYKAAKDSKCTGTDAQDLNQCLCGNGGDFVTKSAQCLGREDKSDVVKVYKTMSSACSVSKTPMSSNSSSGGDDNKSPVLSKGATIGVAIGAAVAGMLTMGALVLFLRHRQRKKTEEETSPMLTQNDYYKRSTATTFPPTEPSPSFGQLGGDVKPSWTPSPPLSHSSPGFNKSSAQYAGPYATPVSSEDPAVQRASGQAFEMDASAMATNPSTGGPVEMEGSVPPTHHQARY
ncbi:hypothetical protein ED733_005838 [Metarhizium rileyi]|uniref:Extracellular membrane protein CFEM domain-containing protein n=1 Tax=Metarhizium rileyi (strain RCEF 4871) TaxID=1649241 RepID=A0A5C6GBX9_METRR|nr:hypothetical protein ED733_005838 [Metarhizium rileyi]